MANYFCINKFLHLKDFIQWAWIISTIKTNSKKQKQNKRQIEAKTGVS